ncbi:MAG: hypothetical protein J6C23_02365 [Clostridia bacterium]|nr:hypothetical protein [Clostridia bacterium]
MNLRVLKQIDNVPRPSNTAEPQTQLEKVLNLVVNSKTLSSQELNRLDNELNLIKRWRLENVVLFNLDVTQFLSENYFLNGKENSLFINYVLGITKVNSLHYNLPHKFYFNDLNTKLPSICFYVKKGEKAKLLNFLYLKYNDFLFVKGANNSATYFTYPKKTAPSLSIKEHSITMEDGSKYKDYVALVSTDDLCNLGFYSFSILEISDLKVENKNFSQREILDKTIELFGFQIDKIFPFNEDNTVCKLLNSTNNRLLYKEQLIELSTVKNKDFLLYTQRIKQYTVSKTYVIACLIQNPIF